jgi:maleylpyruvate isomerase
VLATAAGISDEQAREPSSLPGWSRGHVLTHLARNADGLRNLLIWARTGVVTPQYPSFEVRNEEIEAGAGRPARELVVDFADSATAFEAETARLRDGDWAAEVRGVRGAAHPAWYTLWRRLSELEIHHVDLDAGYTHDNWPAEFVSLMLPRVVPTLDTRLTDKITVQVQTPGRQWTQASTAAPASDDPVIVRGTASAVLCWLTGRPVPAAADLTTSRSGRDCPLPQLRPWS